MTRLRHQILAEVISDFFQSNNNDKKLTVNHFSLQNVPRKTVYNVINRYLQSGSAAYKPIPGRKPEIIRTPLKKPVLTKIKKNPSISVRQLAFDLDKSPSTIWRAKKKLDVKTRKKRKAPLY